MRLCLTFGFPTNPESTASHNDRFCLLEWTDARLIFALWRDCLHRRALLPPLARLGRPDRPSQSKNIGLPLHTIQLPIHLSIMQPAQSFTYVQNLKIALSWLGIIIYRSVIHKITFGRATEWL